VARAGRCARAQCSRLLVARLGPCHLGVAELANQLVHVLLLARRRLCRQLLRLDDVDAPTLELDAAELLIIDCR
jgi:hypothetical protein